MQDVMLDLETMGAGPNAAIVAIGAASFSLETGELGNTFYNVVDLNTWWLSQGDEARKALTHPESGRQRLTNALLNFSKFVTYVTTDHEGVTHDLVLWGNGANFDNVILRSAYKQMGINPPWKFYNDRCYRTVKNPYLEIRMFRGGTHHNALHDAIDQATHLIAMLGPAARLERKSNEVVS
jgi:exodeoxyribonuclease VIII